MKLKIVALATVIIAVAVFPIAFMAYKEFYVKPLLLSYPEFLRPWVDWEPFLSTAYGYFTVLVWMGLGVSWLVIVVIKISKLKVK